MNEIRATERPTVSRSGKRRHCDALWVRDSVRDVERSAELRVSPGVRNGQLDVVEPVGEIQVGRLDLDRDHSLTCSARRRVSAGGRLCDNCPLGRRSDGPNLCASSGKVQSLRSRPRIARRLLQCHDRIVTCCAGGLQQYAQKSTEVLHRNPLAIVGRGLHVNGNEGGNDICDFEKLAIEVGHNNSFF